MTIYYCQYNQRALALFANANQINVSSDADKILRSLDKHLDYAEKFIINLYYNYGVEMSYFALKDAGFTIKETDIAESIWKKEQEKQNIIAEKKRQEKEHQFSIFSISFIFAKIFFAKSAFSLLNILPKSIWLLLYFESLISNPRKKEAILRIISLFPPFKYSSAIKGFSFGKANLNSNNCCIFTGLSFSIFLRLYDYESISTLTYCY